jgi:hypothetical protein
MAVTIRHFINSYLDDIYWLTRGGRYYNDEAFNVRQSLKGQGLSLSSTRKRNCPRRSAFVLCPSW